MNAILLLVCCVLPPDLPHVEDEVDTLETNHVYSAETGCRNFTQLLGWHGMAESVGWWRMVKQFKPGESELGESQMVPVRSPGGGYVVMFHEGSTLRVVRAKHVMEWHGQVDVEVAEREELPKEKRRDLRPVPPLKPYVREFPATQ
jgi:hypothetical protein